MIAKPPFATLELTVGTARLTLVPDAGGAIAAWRIDSQSMFHESGIAAAPHWDPLAMASFPLVPYSNRIGRGEFEWQGNRYRLPTNREDFPHPLHGVGWLKPWHVAGTDNAFAVLHYSHPGDAHWPWPFFAEQRFALSPKSLVIDLAVRNLGETDVPLAIGLHPYFDAYGARLQFAAGQVWHVGPEQLPTRAEPPCTMLDFSDGKAVSESEIDNCFDDWDGEATIMWPARPYGLKIVSDLKCAVVYTPSEAAFFCFEPVPHSNNSLNLGSAGQQMPVVAPGESFDARVVFDAWERI